MTVQNDLQKINELKTRGVDEIIDQEHLDKLLQSGKKIRVKLGIDPTSPNLHLGRSVPLLKMRDFERLGHQVVLIIGDATGVIGDTSDKTSERPMLGQEFVDKNTQAYFEQLGTLIDLEKAEVHRNSDWLNKLTYTQIGEQANVFSINKFIQRDNIRRRLDEGLRVSLRETLYPLMQGYDSVAIKADVELGGTDQRFNLLAGRELQRYYGQVPQAIMMFPLIEGTDGRKMSSSWGNTVNFRDEATDMYGKIMTVHDELIVKYFTMLTREELAVVQEYEKALKNNENPKEIKQKLAHKLVAMYHSQGEADKAQAAWIAQFQHGGIPEDIPSIMVARETPLIDALTANSTVSSKSEVRRLVEQGGIQIMDFEGKNPQKVANPAHPLDHPGIIKIGKRRYVRIKMV